MPRILIVDESPRVLYEAGKILSECGYEVHIAHNSIAGLSVLEKCEFRLVLVDYNPLVVNGLECLTFLQTMKADKRFKHIPFIVWGKEDIKEVSDNAEKNGGRFLLKKPPYSNLPAMVSQMIASVASTVG